MLAIEKENPAQADMMRQATFDTGAEREIAARAGPDPRADGGWRTVLIERRRITIRRRVQGMKMHLSLPVESYLGVAIGRARRRDGALYRISLAHRDPELCVTLKEARDLAAMRDAQRHFAAFFAMPILPACGGAGACGAVAGAGASDAATRAPDSIARGCARRSAAQRRREIRRRASALRPPTVFRGEREIIARE